MTKNKLLIFAPLIVLAVVFIFSLTLFPGVQPKPKDLPIAIVNEDQGVKIAKQPEINIGANMVDMIQKSSKQAKDAPVKWRLVKNEKAARKGLDEQKYYGALVIPKDFSMKQVSLKTAEPSSPELHIYVNQGMNMAASSVAAQILNGAVDKLNDNVRSQLLKGYESQNASLTAKQASYLTSPIKKQVINVNEVGENSANGNAPISLFQPTWIASLAAAIIYISVRKVPVVNRKGLFMSKIWQISIGAIAALAIGFGLTWIVGTMVGLHIPNFLDTALFLSITSYSFFLMILAVLSLIGLKGIPIFALLLFFGAPLLGLAPEMMSPFYQDWVYSWLPMRFMVGGLRNLLFFGEGLTWNFDMSVLVWIGTVSMAVILVSVYKRNIVKEQIIESE